MPDVDPPALTPAQLTALAALHLPNRICINDLDSREQRRSACRPESANLPRISAARDAAYAALRAQAKTTALREIKRRARSYAKRPRELDAFGSDLLDLSPKRLVPALESIARKPDIYRWFGFGGEVQAINLRAARIYARHRRAKEHQLARRAAES